MAADTLAVGILPLDIVFAGREENILNASRMAAEARESCDILVLPELFSTGYANDPAAMRALAEPVDGPTIGAMRGLSAATGAALCGSFACLAADGSVRNRAFFITPDGGSAFYDKRHLFSMSREAEVFSPGVQAIPVVSFRGWNVAMCVCYDLRFPAWMRNRDYAYDIMLLPANWPRARAYALEHLLIARAIENQAPIVCANRSGSDAYGTYDGCSYAFDHMGHPAIVESTVPHARFDLQAIRQARKRFPAANDADSYNFL